MIFFSSLFFFNSELFKCFYFWIRLLIIINENNINNIRYKKYSRKQRGALMPLVLWRHYPGRRWYVMGTDDTLYSPLAMAQYLSNYDPFEEW
jgi:hypothetical protein